MVSLEQLLQYKHSAAVAYFKRNFPTSSKNAQELFENMLKYLWLSWQHSIEKKLYPHKEELNFLFVMHEEMREIDDMWHVFILYTRDYTDFCQKYFGEYIHHQPDVVEKHPQTIEKFTADLEKFLAYMYDKLGEETMRCWFGGYLET